ncbi:hypothetical protein T06_10353 [Trichinella sp. T6]|nr:hypothetical protein T06_10353 [Trichinella sp. T6]
MDASSSAINCLSIYIYLTSRDDKRDLAVLVGREPAVRGLSSPGTALALSAASLTGAASLTTVAASLAEPAALCHAQLRHVCVRETLAIRNFHAVFSCRLFVIVAVVNFIERWYFELSMSTFQMWHQR